MEQVLLREKCRFYLVLEAVEQIHFEFKARVVISTF
jgi:hypothetical protein